MILLVVFSLGGINTIVIRLLFPGPWVPVFQVAGSLMTIGGISAALVLAILGLSEIGRQSGVFNQGRAQAIWTLALIALIGTVVGFRLVSATRRSIVAPSESEETSEKLITYSDASFRFHGPGTPWVRIKDGSLRPDSRASFVRRFPHCWFTITADELADNAEVLNDDHLEIIRAELAATPGSQLLGETPHQFAGTQGVLFKQRAKLGSQDLYFEHWIGITNGFIYQLSGWGSHADRARLTRELSGMFSRFEPLARDQSHSSASAKSPDVGDRSSKYAYSLKLTNSRWTRHTSLETAFPEAESGASRGATCVAVVPVWLRDQTIDLDALSFALLAMLSIDYPDEQLDNRAAIVEKALSGVQFDYSRKVEGVQLHYRLKILTGFGCAYLVAAWTSEKEANADAVLDEALERVSFSDSPSPPPETRNDFSRQEIWNQEYVLHQAGHRLLNLGKHEEALRAFDTASLPARTNAIYAKDALLCLSRLDRVPEGLKYLNEQTPEVRTNREILAFEAFFKARSGLVDEAIPIYERAFAGGHRDDADLRDYIGLLLERRDFQQAHLAVQDYLKTRDSVKARLVSAEILQRENRLAEAIDLLKGEQERSPFDSEVLRALCEICLEADRAGEALDYSRGWVANNPNSSLAHHLMARSEIRLKSYRDAKKSLEMAARLAPSNESIRSDLRYVSGMLGEGSNSMLKDPIDPVPVPSFLTNTPAVGSANFAKASAALYTRCITAIDYSPGKEYRTTDYLWIQVNDVSGVEFFSTIQTLFDPLAEDIFVNELRVLDGGGQTVATGHVDQYFVTDSEDATDRKHVNVPVAGLRPGCQLRLIVTRRSRVSTGGFPFLEHRFARSFPVLESAVFLASPTNGLVIRESDGVVRNATNDGVWWRASNVSAARWEPRQPSEALFRPMLWIADGSQSWDQVASNYLASIQDKLQVDDALKHHVHESTRNLNPEESVRALSAYVQSNLTYKAIEFGRRARIPNTPSQVMNHRYGDCKDHSVLLQQLLAAAGIQAHLALVGKHPELLPNLPTLDQFNHMIVFVPGPVNGTFIDCTDKGADLVDGIPPGLAGYHTLILDPDHPRLLRIPEHPPGWTTILIEQDVVVTNDTDVLVNETIALTGVHAATIRRILRLVTAADQKPFMQRWIGLPEVELRHLEIKPLRPGEPVRVEYSYRRNEQFRSYGKQLTGRLHSSVVRTYLAVEPRTRERETPFEIRNPLSVRQKVRIKSPKGYRWRPDPASASTGESSFVTHEIQCRISKDDELELAFELRQLPGLFPASDYSQYRDAMRRALAALETEVHLERQPTP